MRRTDAPRYALMDLFAGCGGMTRGFVDSGRFEPTFAVEMDRDAAETYRRNFGDHVMAERIEDVPAWPRVDVVIGGPPCQGFSPLNRDGVGLERRALWRHYYIALRDSGAQAFVMENVPQLLRSPEYIEFRAKAVQLGFDVVEDVLLAADYGVPRPVVVRSSSVSSMAGAELPPATHFPPQAVPFGGREWRTFRWAVSNPTQLTAGARWPQLALRTESHAQPASSATRRSQTRARDDLNSRRGGPDITPACWLNKRSGTTDVFGRLWWDKPAYTIRTEFFKPEKGRYLHPSEHRPITIREAARCMSFPDDFVLPDDQSMTSVARQVGNAVPCLLAQRIADELAACLDGAQAAPASDPGERDHGELPFAA